MSLTADISTQNSGDTTNARQTAVEYAMAQIGKPYVFAASGPNAYDCSGLTAMAWQAAGLKITHNAAAQFGETQHIPVDSAQAGDLIFVGAYNPSSGEPHHVAMCIGGGQLVEAYDTGYPIRVASISEYANKGLNPMAGSMPDGSGSFNGIQTVAATSNVAASSGGGLADFFGLGGVSNILSTITSVSFWKRAGMFAMGALILFFTVRWMIKNEL